MALLPQDRMEAPIAADRSDYGFSTVRTVRPALPSPCPRVAMTDRLDAARDRIGRAVFKKWDKRDIDELTRLMRKFADAMTVDPPAVK